MSTMKTKPPIDPKLRILLDELKRREDFHQNHMGANSDIHQAVVIALLEVRYAMEIAVGLRNGLRKVKEGKK